ncbi:hypothetical protein E2C01_055541 [Portunus trituberculatus]|uniref:Uncharacterized protein n=1 Tax=Portunus trituberculatus TaxID=210409 RepID=A0A5B7GVA8_PORTR|nr:hypothetical protein [Portunus trituberculatus]
MPTALHPCHGHHHHHHHHLHHHHHGHHGSRIAAHCKLHHKAIIGVVWCLRDIWLKPPPSPPRNHDTINRTLTSHAALQ